MVQLTQTSPTYSIVCPGDRLVLTCIVTGTNGGLTWQADNGVQQILPASGGQSSATAGSFFVNITESNNTTIISTATNDTASVTLDEANVKCIVDGANFEQLTIDVFQVNITFKIVF